LTEDFGFWILLSRLQARCLLAKTAGTAFLLCTNHNAHDYRLAFGADRATNKLDLGGLMLGGEGLTIDSPPLYGVSPCGHGTFVPVQTTYKPSVVLLIVDGMEET